LPHAIELRRRRLTQEVLMSALGSDEKIEFAQTESPLRGELEAGLTTPDRDERIREIAYFLWLDEGCPEGGAERHWSAAEALLESEPLERKRIEGEPPGEPLGEAPTEPRARRVRAS
jgi:Protein of unknown function (DUF2934)